MPEEQTTVARVGKSLKLGQGLLKGLAQHLSDVASLTKEVIGLRARVSNLQALHLREQVLRIVLQKQLDAIVGTTDRLGFGKRMV